MMYEPIGPSKLQIIEGNIKTLFNQSIRNLIKFRKKISFFIFPREEKIQLLWSTWVDVCDLIKFKNGTKGYYVDGYGNITNSYTNLIGLFYNNNNEGWIIQQGDWIIKDKSGKISYMTDDQMKRSILLEKLSI